MHNTNRHEGINGYLPLEQEVKSLRKDTDWLKAELEKMHNKFEMVHTELMSSKTGLKENLNSDLQLLHSTNQSGFLLVSDTESSKSINDRSRDSQKRVGEEESSSQSRSGTSEDNGTGIDEVEDPSQNFAQERGFSDVLGPIPNQNLLEQQSANFANVDLSKSDLDATQQYDLPSHDRKSTIKKESSRFFISNAVGEYGEEAELETDIYSLLMISHVWSLPFFYAIAVAVCQYFITFLILVDLLVDESVMEVRDDNPLNVPSKVEWPVICAQFLSLLIAFISVDDIITSLKMFIIGYDPNIVKQHRGATYVKFLVANLTRFFEGMCTIFVSLLLIVISNNVMEIFMNFVAVSFVSTLDNLAFQVAEDGLCGERLRRACKGVVETKVKVQKTKIGWAMNLLFFMFFLPFLSVLTLTTIRQNNGYFLAATSCKNLEVHFGDEMYEFPPDVRFRFEGSGISKTLPKSKRQMPFLPEKPNPLMYQQFSGNYVAETFENSTRLKEFNSRPIYFERGLNDPTSGMFYYCNNIRSWVFTIEALYDTDGAIPEEARAECKWGWLLQSPVTDAVTLDEAPMTNWNIWTGDMQVTTSAFSITCTDCKRNSDCGLVHGTCDRDSGTCICNDNRQGRRCNVEKPYCRALVWLHYGLSASEYSEERLFTIGRLRDGSVSMSYDRPLYARPISLSEVEIIAYGGERWYYTIVSWDDIRILRDLDDVHSYWYNAFDRFVEFYSDRTSSHNPLGITWHRVQESKSRGTFGFFGASYQVNARFECLDNNCMDRPVMCGDFGECVTGAENGMLLNAAGRGELRDIPFRHCKCSDYYGGYFCEHSPHGPYAGAMYDEYIADPDAYTETHKDEEYLKYWVQ